MDISFVIIEYFSLAEISPCLEALRRHAQGLSHEAIVSSNSGYPREEQERLEMDYPQIRWLFNERNGGFAYAADRGIEATSGEAVVLLNADARLRGELNPALCFMKNHPGAAVIGPRIVNAEGELQDSARPFMTPLRALKRSVARIFNGKRVILEKNFDYGRTQLVDWVIGAFMMIKRSAIDKAGMLDERYFMYLEDMDWCKRFWDRGFQVYYFPGLAVEFAGTRRSTAFLSGSTVTLRYPYAHAGSYLRFLLKHRFSFRRRDGAPAP